MFHALLFMRIYFVKGYYVNEKNPKLEKADCFILIPSSFLFFKLIFMVLKDSFVISNLST